MMQGWAAKCAERLADMCADADYAEYWFDRFVDNCKSGREELGLLAQSEEEQLFADLDVDGLC